MPSLRYSENAMEDLRRLGVFLVAEDPLAAEATSVLIQQALQILESHPLIGRLIADDFRALVISRGNTGYLALYTFNDAIGEVLVHAIRHQRESGFDEA